MERVGGVAIVVLLGACGRIGFDPLDSNVRPDGIIPTNDGADPSCIAQIDAGFRHACVRATDGRVWCWGASNLLQLGDGFSGDRNYPALAPNFVGPATISLGGYHDCQLDGAGNVSCLGANYAGQLGQGGTGNSAATLRPVTLPAAVMQLAGGEEHTCALLVDGRVYCWGNNFFGEIGDGSTMRRAAPVSTGLTGVLEIAVGDHHNCARTATDTLCWGDNQFGQLGDGTKMQHPSPTSTGYSGATMMAAGDHTCAIASTGTMVCWGYNQNGQLGNNSTMDSTVPFTPNGLPAVKAMALGYHHTCAITTADELYCWGENNVGQVGNNSSVDVHVPTLIVSTSPSKPFVTAGWDFTCALDSMDSLSCWGENAQGQLGDGTNDPHAVPKASLFSCDIQ